MRARIFVAALLAGCSSDPLALLDRITPGGAAVRGFAYGADARQALDVYRPAAALVPGARVPVVVFFYGGRWQGFARSQFRFVGEAFASRGYLAVLPDTRVYPDVVFPAFVEDGVQALRWVEDHAAEHGGDPGRVFLAGHSAGAHVAALLALDARWRTGAGVPAAHLAGFIGMSGPYDFLPFADADVRALMGPEAGWPETQPIRFVSPDDPPTLLQYGLRDDLVFPHNARNLQAALRAQGVPAGLIEYPSLDHYGVVASLAAPLRAAGAVFEHATIFIEARLKAIRPS